MHIRRYFAQLAIRNDAGRLLLYVLVSFGASVVLTRAYLEAMNYPQIGGSVLHFAHLLWGGLSMAVAGIVLLVFATPRVHVGAAILVGLGIGLFIDEVGKFITVDNDYFFRPAAPIIYVVFLLMALLYLAVRRNRASDERKLISALEQVQALIEAPLSEEHHEELRRWLIELKQTDDLAKAQLALALEKYVETQQVRDTVFSRLALRIKHGRSALQAFFERHVRIITVAVFVIIILRILGGIITLWIALNAASIPDTIELFVPENVVGIVLELVTSAILLLGMVVFFSGRRRDGLFWLQTAMVLALTVVGVVTFYEEQFVAAINMMGDLTIWVVLRGYAHRLVLAQHHGNAPIDKSRTAPQPLAPAAQSPQATNQG